MRNSLVDYLNSLPWFKVTAVVLDDSQVVVRVTCNHWKDKEGKFITFRYPEYQPHEALYSSHTEQWLSKLTGYQQITIWSQK